jgi:hypothetical protein
MKKKLFITILSLIGNFAGALTNQLKNEKIELHWTICEKSFYELNEKIELKTLNNLTRTVEYYDISDGLVFYNKGIALRVRNDHNGWYSTVKTTDSTRALKATDKCEWDRIGQLTKHHCSFHSPLNKGSYPLTIYQALTDDQLEILKDKKIDLLDLEKLTQTGQIEQNVHEYQDQDGNKIDIEVTEIDSSNSIIELSLKTKIDKADKIQKSWDQRLASKKIKLCDLQQSKTKQILEAKLHR